MRRNPDEILRSIEREEKSGHRGILKIFFGYAAGVGKTYAMLMAAHAAQKRGVDVVAGYIELHKRPQTTELMEGLEILSSRNIKYNGITLREFDLDAALLRKPELILVDELAHTNAPGCRHKKRYQDIKELLHAGIDVYTTVNVQHIESLNDIVASISGVSVKECIPDAVFDDADQVSLVDIEPQDLLERMKEGVIYQKEQARRAMDHFFTIENLTALREIALRRCAERINMLSESVAGGTGKDYYTDEHILVCLSSSPSNAKIVRTASRMANAFRGRFTALFVETPDTPYMSPEDKKRLQENTQLAQRLGAQVEKVYGENIPFQIAEFARLFAVSKIVIGRSAASPKGIFGKATLTEKLIIYAPNMDIHIIPDSKNENLNYNAQSEPKKVAISAKEIAKSVGILILTSVIGVVFQNLGFSEANIITVYILSVLVIAILTNDRKYSLISSAASVIIFNFLFTEPKYTLHAYDPGYPITFLVMFLAAFLTGTLAGKLKNAARQSAKAAYHTKILFDMDQIFHKEHEKTKILDAMAKQLVRVLNRDMVVYEAEGGVLSEPQFYKASDQSQKSDCLNQNEQAVALWVMKNRKRAGATTDTLSGAKCLYYAIRMNENVYGVVGVKMEERALDAFENSILLSILGECALALENEKNRKEKEEADLLAQNEKLRANLLRAISHDLRTPLTSISGNAGVLLSSGDIIPNEKRRELYTDIYDDSLWLINLVENLLSVTRLEDGSMNLQMKPELLEEIITEALRHVNRKSKEHEIVFTSEEELILVKVDARLIVQVLINIIDNAIKYTQKGSHIRIRTFVEEEKAVVSIADDGPGISKEAQKHIFDMFYTANQKIVDGRRSLGLGLALCKSIIQAHGGNIKVKEQKPKGTMFLFTLPMENISIEKEAEKKSESTY